MSSLVCTNARSDRYGCNVAPANATAPTKTTPAAAAAMISRLPAGRCGTRICSSCGASSPSEPSWTGSSSTVGSGSVTVFAARLALPTGVRPAGLGASGSSASAAPAAGAETAAGSDAFVRRRNRPHRLRGVAGSASAASATVRSGCSSDSVVSSVAVSSPASLVEASSLRSGIRWRRRAAVAPVASSAARLSRQFGTRRLSRQFGSRRLSRQFSVGGQIT